MTPDSRHYVPTMRRYTQTCDFCGGRATVLAPPNSDELDVLAEFSAAGRSFGEDGDEVACHACARKQTT